MSSCRLAWIFSFGKSGTITGGGTLTTGAGVTTLGGGVL
jgi:hypothetical protein